MQKVQDDYLYTAYTSCFSGELDTDGRAAMFQCNSDAEFAIDMTGAWSRDDWRMQKKSG
jgi:hypothetical protein